MNRLFLSTILLALGARALSAQGWPQTWDTPCTLDVVLVTFRDTTAARPNVSYDYHDYDLPGNSSYRLRDFQRLLTGGYDEDGNHDEGTVFMGDTVTVANNDTLPAVYGSLRAYFDSVSSGAFELHVRMINPTDDQGYPRWVVLPRSKGHYAEIDLGHRILGDLFWDDAQATAQDSVDAWYPNTDAYDIPGQFLRPRAPFAPQGALPACRAYVLPKKPARPAASAGGFCYTAQCALWG